MSIFRLNKILNEPIIRYHIHPDDLHGDFQSADVRFPRTDHLQIRYHNQLIFLNEPPFCFEIT